MAPPDYPCTADEALERLVAGNRRFVRGEARLPTIQTDILANLAHGQQPYATIIGCSDSRVPPEIIFDAGFNALFIVRIAGNVISPDVAGSIQFAALHLKTPLFVVMGHEGCGAVTAALASKFADKRHARRIEMMLERIIPGLDGIDPHAPPEVQLAAAVEANVRWSMHLVRDTPDGRARMDEGILKLVGAVYELTTGRVRFLD